jgi:hypothetical protein
VNEQTQIAGKVIFGIQVCSYCCTTGDGRRRSCICQFGAPEKASLWARRPQRVWWHVPNAIPTLLYASSKVSVSNFALLDCRCRARLYCSALLTATSLLDQLAINLGISRHRNCRQAALPPLHHFGTGLGKIQPQKAGREPTSQCSTVAVRNEYSVPRTKIQNKLRSFPNTKLGSPMQKSSGQHEVVKRGIQMLFNNS